MLTLRGLQHELAIVIEASWLRLELLVEQIEICEALHDVPEIDVCKPKSSRECDEERCLVNVSHHHHEIYGQVRHSRSASVA